MQYRVFFDEAHGKIHSALTTVTLPSTPVRYHWAVISYVLRWERGDAYIETQKNTGKDEKHLKNNYRCVI